MSVPTIQEALLKVEEYYKSKSDPGPEADTRATAIMENGLVCGIKPPNGKTVYTDMPDAVGGTTTAGSPGWLQRAAIASCDATLLTMRAAREGIKLDVVEVSVDSMSDGRGLFLDEGISPGSTGVRILFKIGATGVPREKLQEMVDWVSAHSPVGTDVEKAVDVSVELEIV